MTRSPLSIDAERYISAINDVHQRRAGRDYGTMDSQEFQARMGLAVDALQAQMSVQTKATASIASDIAEIRNVVSPSSPRVPTLVIAGGSGLGFAGIIEAVRRWFLP